MESLFWKRAPVIGDDFVDLNYLYFSFVSHLIYSVTFFFFTFYQVKLYQEKRSDLEEQQLHLNVGLQKIRETVEQVEELQKSLSIKRIELEEKNAAANAKLKQMVST